MKFRKKPIEIEAVRIGKRMDILNPEWLTQAIQSNQIILHGMGKMTRDQCWVEVKTIEGVMLGNDGDWIIRGVEGELYPCKNSIFKATYEEAKEEKQEKKKYEISDLSWHPAGTKPTMLGIYELKDLPFPFHAFNGIDFVGDADFSVEGVVFTSKINHASYVRHSEWRGPFERIDFIND